MKHIKKFNENFSKLWRKSPKSDEDIKIGDKVMIPSFEGDPIGDVYDIDIPNTKLLASLYRTSHDTRSYWVDLGKFGKMEFSREEIVKI